MSWVPICVAGLLFSAAAIPSRQDVEPKPETVMPAASEIIDGDVDHLSRMTIPVQIKGQGPFPFMLDTGSERTAISQQLAGTLQLEFAHQAILMSLSGSQTVDMVHLTGLKIGKHRYIDLVSPLLQQQNMGAVGILGLDGMQNQRVVLDFRNNTIEIENSKRRDMDIHYDISLDAREKGGQLILTDARISGVKVDIVIDTGMQGNLGNRILQQRLYERRAIEIGKQAELISVTGQSLLADYQPVENLRIGAARIKSIPIAFADAPPFKRLNLDKKPAIFLGMETLRGFDRIAIDFGKRNVYFDTPDRRF